MRVYDRALLALTTALLISLSPGVEAQTRTTVNPKQPATAADAAFADQQDIPYATVNGSVLKLDIYQPTHRDAQALPAVLLIHGGGWTSLDKSHDARNGPVPRPFRLCCCLRGLPSLQWSTDSLASAIG